jgi:AcrR family transcriptional regulator
MTTSPAQPKQTRCPRKSAPQARGLLRREKILAAATALFASKPFDDISYNDLADHAGVPVGSLYHFFPSKLAICAALAQVIEAAFNACFQLPDIPNKQKFFTCMWKSSI